MSISWLKCVRKTWNGVKSYAPLAEKERAIRRQLVRYRWHYGKFCHSEKGK